LPVVRRLWQACKTAGDAIESRLLRGTVASATQKVREGDSLHSSLSSMGIMPELALDMIEVGESSGALRTYAHQRRGIYEEEVKLAFGSDGFPSSSLPYLSSWGLFVAFILISLYLPIFSISVTGTTGAG